MTIQPSASTLLACTAALVKVVRVAPTEAIKAAGVAFMLGLVLSPSNLAAQTTHTMTPTINAHTFISLHPSLDVNPP